MDLAEEQFQDSDDEEDNDDAWKDNGNHARDLEREPCK